MTLTVVRLSVSPTQPQYKCRRHCKAYIRSVVMCSLQPLISSPVHAFRFGRERVENCGIAAKELTDFLCFTKRPIAHA